MAKIASNTRKISSIKKANRVDMPLLIIVLILLAFGIVMVLSASAPSALSEYGNSYRYVITQGIAAIGGLVLMFLIIKLNDPIMKLLKKHYKLIYILSIAILFTVLIPKVGVEGGGARRWIKIGVQMQPSELTKIGLIIYFAGYFTDERNEFNNFSKQFKLEEFWKKALKPLIALMIPVAILYFVQNHLSAGIVMGIIAVVIIIMAGCEFRYLFSLAAMGIAGLGFILLVFKDKLSSSFRSDRIEAWLRPFENMSDKGYQTVQGLYAIGSGKLFGVGLGASKQKYLYIPEAHNDFIFAIIAEELGFVGCVAVIILFTLFAIRGVLISIRARDMFESLVAIGITTLITAQALINIAVVTNTIPNTGMSLPFLSYGGTSLLILLGCVGLLLGVSRNAKKI